MKIKIFYPIVFILFLKESFLLKGMQIDHKKDNKKYLRFKNIKKKYINNISSKNKSDQETKFLRFIKMKKISDEITNNETKKDISIFLENEKKNLTTDDKEKLEEYFKFSNMKIEKLIQIKNTINLINNNPIYKVTLNKIKQILNSEIISNMKDKLNSEKPISN